MNQSRERILGLFAGDIIVFVFALWLTLVLRDLAVPEIGYLLRHILPFSLVFVVWLMVFYIAGLYDKHSSPFRDQLPATITKAQLVNSSIAVLFFYLVPFFGIAPRTILFINLLVTLGLILIWRMYFTRSLLGRERQKALIVGESSAVAELRHAINDDPGFGLRVVNDGTVRADSKEIAEMVESEGVSVVIMSLREGEEGRAEGKLLETLITKASFIDLETMYEEVFGRVNLELVDDRWFLENISLKPHASYETAKRLMDMLAALPLFLVSLVFYPFMILAQQLETRGPIFYTSKRIGQGGKTIMMSKFRSMTGVDDDKGAAGTEHRVTKVGKILRTTRIDETPQLWSMIRGDLSFIGPRPEFPSLVKHYEENIPFYAMRHAIKPGVSGWAQVNDKEVPREDADVELTRNKLSYDLYYIKNRSIFLDLKIALKTIKTVLTRAGS